MYAELAAFPRPEYSGGTLPRRNPDATTIYAQIDHNLTSLPPPQHQLPPPPSQHQLPPPPSQHFIPEQQIQQLHQHQLSPQHQTTNLPQHMRHATIGHSIGIPTLPLGTPYPTPAPPQGFGGAPVFNPSSPPPVLHEEEELDNAETPLMNNHKESEV